MEGATAHEVINQVVAKTEADSELNILQIIFSNRKVLQGPWRFNRSVFTVLRYPMAILSYRDIELFADRCRHRRFSSTLYQKEYDLRSDHALKSSQMLMKTLSRSL